MTLRGLPCAAGNLSVQRLVALRGTYWRDALPHLRPCLAQATHVPTWADVELIHNLVLRTDAWLTENPSASMHTYQDRLRTVSAAAEPILGEPPGGGGAHGSGSGGGRGGAGRGRGVGGYGLYRAPRTRSGGAGGGWGGSPGAGRGGSGHGVAHSGDVDWLD
jgi:hypothetical protein